MQNNIQIKNLIPSYIPAILMAGIFFYTCVNDVKDVEKFKAANDIPTEMMKEAIIQYIDSGYTKAKLETPLIEKYNHVKRQMLFPQGLTVTFYNPEMKPISRLTSNWGMYDELNRKLILKNRVVFINFEKKDTLNTNLLNWTQDSAKVYTDKLVVLKNPTGIFKSRGGFVANENFSWYEFRKVEGTYHINDSIQ